MVSQEILQNWKFRKKGDDIWLDAIVPGCVHTDLFNNKLIPDPFHGTNANDLQWIENEDWEYSCEFMVSSYLLDHDRLEIWFYGVDTFAEIVLNGQSIIQTNNMFHPWSADVKNNLLPGKNSIEVTFASPYKKGLEKLREFPYRLPAPNDKGKSRVSPFVRKAAYQFGWDFAPRLLTSGFWKSIEIMAWNQLKIRDFYVLQKELDKSMASLSCELELEVHSAGEYIYSVYVDQDLISIGKSRLSGGINTLSLPFSIYDPKFWYPKGHGNPDLYKITVDFKDENQVIDTRQTTTGLRTVELIRARKDENESFQFRINGRDIYIKGANVVPPEYFLSRAGKKEAELLVENAVAVNMNMLRVWGGAAYENDYFYNLCNRKGILIWQDFMFACMMYPSDPPFLSSVKQEVEYNVKRLRNHPSVALWCGNNEILEGFHLWGWKKELGEYAEQAYSSYHHLFHELIPSVLKPLDSSRPYWPSSPSAGTDKPPSIESGDYHFWDIVKNKLPLASLEENVGRFMSEFGFKSYPGINTIRSFTGEQDLHARSEVLEFHQGWKNGAELVERHSRMLFGSAGTFEIFLFLSQLTQREALKKAIEAHRRAKPYCMGSLFWQLNDCWPGATWSAVDYYGRWKAIMYELKHLYSDVMISANVKGKELSVQVVSENPEPLNVNVSVRLIKFDGQELFRKEAELKAGPSSPVIAYTAGLDKLNIANLKNQVVLVSEVFENEKLLDRNLYYFLKPSELMLAPGKPEVELSESGDKTLFFIKSMFLTRNVFIESIGCEGFFSDNYFDLLPGERRTVIFQADNPVHENIHFRITTLNGVFSGSDQQNL